MSNNYLTNVNPTEILPFVSPDINSVLGSHGAGVTGSYLQENRHAVVSERFQVIQPASIGSALSDRNFSLVSLITGKGRQEGTKDFQRTIARYRSADAFGVEGLFLDVLYISKHMGRGCDELRLAFMRGVCANAWNSGTLFNIVRFRHSGNPLENIAEGIEQVLSNREKLKATIEKMQSLQLTSGQIDELAKKFADIRLKGAKNVASVNHRELAVIHRKDDEKIDLFTVANILQENAVRHPLSYEVNSVDKDGQPYVRQMHTRRLNESSAQAVDLNSALFDEAFKLVA